MAMMQIGFGGGCHWCTEAVFQALSGVENVAQGWIASVGENSEFSEAVIVCFSPEHISLDVLIAIHLHTHSCTSNHSLRRKYRSAIYTFHEEQISQARDGIEALRSSFDRPIITQVLPFHAFRENKEMYRDYYQKNNGNQFCKNYITPKLQLLMQRYSKHVALAQVQREGLRAKE